jgi:hypothetical protein
MGFKGDKAPSIQNLLRPKPWPPLGAVFDPVFQRTKNE